MRDRISHGRLTKNINNQNRTIALSLSFRVAEMSVLIGLYIVFIFSLGLHYVCSCSIRRAPNLLFASSGDVHYGFFRCTCMNHKVVLLLLRSAVCVIRKCFFALSVSYVCYDALKVCSMCAQSSVAHCCRGVLCVYVIIE